MSPLFDKAKLTDKYKNVLALGLGNTPLHIRNVSVKDHTDSLENEFLVDSLDCQDALVSIQIGAVLLDKSTNPSREHHLIHVALDLARHRRDRAVVLMIAIIFEKVRLEFKHSLQIECLNVQQILRTNLGCERT